MDAAQAARDGEPVQPVPLEQAGSQSRAIHNNTDSAYVYDSHKGIS